MFRRDFQMLAESRIREARCLLNAQLGSGAYYLAGYAIECALKACIAKRLLPEQFPWDKDYIAQRVYTHNLAVLLGTCGLRELIDEDGQSNRGLLDSWNVVIRWSEHARYKQWTVSDAQVMIEAVDDPIAGVLTWLRQHW